MKFSGRIKDVNSDFEFLEQPISDDEAQQYYVDWMAKYRKYFRDGSEIKTIIMANRSIRARREIITSAILFEESKVARDNGCISATYFLTYYSLFHAMWSVLFLNSDLNNSISEITHQKLKNLFCDYYTRNNFFDVDMKDYITKHKDMREFFSYNVPFNMIGDAIDFDLIEQIVLKCFQLTNLHNSMLAKCSGFLNVTEENIPWIKTYFAVFNGRTRENGKMLEDPSEEHQLIEMLKYGIKIENYEIELSNDWDEMGYAYYLDGKFDEVAVDRVKSNALNLVYKAIRY